MIVTCEVIGRNGCHKARIEPCLNAEFSPPLPNKKSPHRGGLFFPEGTFIYANSLLAQAEQDES